MSIDPALFTEEKIKTDPILQFFAFSHLPTQLARISRHFALMANYVVDTLPRNPERTAALRKLLEAKDCAVRAQLYKAEPPND